MSIPVVINAGGLGTRLLPLTKDVPKPLVRIGHLTIIEYIMKYYQEYGFNDFHIIVNHKKELIKEYFKDKKEYNITFYDEYEKLGSGGGLSLLKGHINSTFILNNCDVLLLTDFNELVKSHFDNNEFVTVVVTNDKLRSSYGLIHESDGVITSFEEKPKYQYEMNCGVYVLEKEALDYFKDNTYADFITVVEDMIKDNKKAGTYSIEHFRFLELGNLQDYLASSKTLKCLSLYNKK